MVEISFKIYINLHFVLSLFEKDYLFCLVLFVSIRYYQTSIQLLLLFSAKCIISGTTWHNVKRICIRWSFCLLDLFTKSQRRVKYHSVQQFYKDCKQYSCTAVIKKGGFYNNSLYSVCSVPFLKWELSRGVKHLEHIVVTAV